MSVRFSESPFSSGEEHCPPKAEVGGSSPLVGTKKQKVGGGGDRDHLHPPYLSAGESAATTCIATGGAGLAGASTLHE